MPDLNKEPRRVIDWSHCDTVLLDMDGTFLDLAFDNYFWRELVPAKIAHKQGITDAEARDQMVARFAAKEGSLEWYCLDYWSDDLDLDLASLKHSIRHKIGFLPDTRCFLEAVKQSHRRLVLVTNAHQETLRVKLSAVDFDDYFDELITSHQFGHAKEHAEFWPALQRHLGFDPARSLFVDDSLAVLQAAANYGIDQVVAIERPDTGLPARTIEHFASVHSLDELMDPRIFVASAP
ncbi:MAG: GMP/IMP nucleotidase [Gammaproteobacteria bacterium]|nr:GMP/IMP nucleotidase [Gammaproteobacteria bacterium]